MGHYAGRAAHKARKKRLRRRLQDRKILKQYKNRFVIRPRKLRAELRLLAEQVAEQLAKAKIAQNIRKMQNKTRAALDQVLGGIVSLPPW